jgi:hypothetical protein
MLGQTLVLVAFVAIFAASIVSATGAGFLVATAARAHVLVAPAVQTALAQYESTVVVPPIANEYDAGNGDVQPASIAALNGEAAWQSAQYVMTAEPGSSLAAVTTVTPTATSAPACAPLGGAVNTGPDTQVNGQCSGFVQESRLSLTLETSVGPPTGATSVQPLAHDVTYATLRLFAQPPYVMLAGLRDDADPGAGHEGDLGGFGFGVTLFGPTDPADTTLHVIYACQPALGDCSQSRPAPADQPTSLPWTNGNGNTTLAE